MKNNLLRKMRFADKRYTTTQHIFITATYFGRLGRREETARLVCLTFRRNWWLEHPTYRAAINNQLAEWETKHGVRPVIHQVM